MSESKSAFIITGPTSGYGHRTALELSRHGTVVLVGRDPSKLKAVRAEVEASGGEALEVVCDLSDLSSVQQAAAQIGAMKLPLAALINNAGMRQETPTQNRRGWDMSFVTNHVGPFVLTEALMPFMPDGSNVVFVVSAVEDPERRPAVAAGFRGARYLSVQASARGEWRAGGSTKLGFDAYATTKQAGLVAALALARENPRLRINAVEPGFSPATNLGRDAPLVVRVLARSLSVVLAPFVKFMTTPARAAKVITSIALNSPGVTGVYFDEKGHPMQGSKESMDPAFQNRVVAETRALLKGA